MKQRIKEELQIVTATRRMKLDEAEEIRWMEAALAEREKERVVKAKEEAKEEERRKGTIQKRHAELQKQLAMEQHQENRSRRPSLDAKKPNCTVERDDKSLTTVSLRSSPKHSAAHKRQNSDPMLAKLSPSEEEHDAATIELRRKLSAEARRIIAAELERYSPQSIKRTVASAGAGRRLISGVSQPTISDADLDLLYALAAGLRLSLPLVRSPRTADRNSSVTSDCRAVNR